jgi:hypothetical protein
MCCAVGVVLETLGVFNLGFSGISLAFWGVPACGFWKGLEAAAKCDSTKEASTRKSSSSCKQKILLHREYKRTKKAAHKKKKRAAAAAVGAGRGKWCGCASE